MDTNDGLQPKLPALLHRFLSESSPPRYTWRVVGIPLTIVVGLLDFYSGAELDITLLYLVPITLAKWKLGKGEAILAAAFSAFIWFVVNYFLLREARTLWVPFWNMIVLFGFFLTVILILSSLRKAFADQRRLIGELQAALKRVETLSGLLPICSYCKQVRDDRGYWQAVEVYIAEHSQAEFTHGVCPNCMANFLAGAKEGGDSVP